jgi:hypothetical protein
MTLKMAVLAPIPRARASSATTEKEGVFQSERSASSIEDITALNVEGYKSSRSQRFGTYLAGEPDEETRGMRAAPRENAGRTAAAIARQTAVSETAGRNGQFLGL